MEKIKIAKDKIRIVIGAGGQTIKSIIEKTKADININDDGEVFISAVDTKVCEEAKKMILLYAEDVKIGQIFDVKIVKIMNFGAFAEIMQGKEGLIHISQLSEKRVEKVEDVIKEGDIVKVKVIGVDNFGKISLSMKQV
jgi:polyribonucleotide nucleotidyltransferase